MAWLSSRLPDLFFQPKSFTAVGDQQAAAAGPEGQPAAGTGQLAAGESEISELRSISRMQKAHEDRLPQHEPLSPKMAARSLSEKKVVQHA
jgi:hypothetical protein